MAYFVPIRATGIVDDDVHLAMVIDCVLVQGFPVGTLCHVGLVEVTAELFGSGLTDVRFEVRDHDFGAFLQEFLFVELAKGFCQTRQLESVEHDNTDDSR